MTLKSEHCYLSSHLVDYEDRLDDARERVLKLIAGLLSDDTYQEQFTGEQDEDDLAVNIPILENLLAENGGEDVIDADDTAELIFESLSNNGRPIDEKRAGSLDCLEASCEDVERRGRQPNRNAHYRTLPFGKRVQRQTFSTVRNTRKSAVKNKNKSRARPPLLPFGK